MCAIAETAWFKHSHVYLMYIWRIKSDAHYRHTADVNREMFSKFMPDSLEHVFLCRSTHTQAPFISC